MAVRIEYRPAGLAFEEFHRVNRECFPDEPLSSDDFASVVAHDFWAAYDGESLVGFSYVVRKPDIAWLARIGTAGTHRHRGVGTLMMSTVVGHCQQTGLPDIMLYVQSDNVTAIRLYERFGFRTTESAYQFILSVPDLEKYRPNRPTETIMAVPITELGRSSLPRFPRESIDIADMHKPPDQYVFVFRDLFGANRGYCRLSPRFPGCFPFVVERPSADLPAVLWALREFLLPEKDILKLTLSGDALADACTKLGLKLNYQLFKMLRSGAA